MLPPCSIHADATEFQRRSANKGRGTDPWFGRREFGLQKADVHTLKSQVVCVMSGVDPALARPKERG